MLQIGARVGDIVAFGQKHRRDPKHNSIVSYHQAEDASGKLTALANRAEARKAWQREHPAGSSPKPEAGSGNGQGAEEAVECSQSICRRIANLIEKENQRAEEAVRMLKSLNPHSTSSLNSIRKQSDLILSGLREALKAAIEERDRRVAKLS